MSLKFLQTALENNNVKAFLVMIRNSEGTIADDGYNYLFSSSPRNDLRFPSFAMHPNEKITANNITSTAAGAYQILYNTWVEIEHKYSLPDFSPWNQDLAACELISQRNCLQKVMDGKFYEALNECATTWASLWGSPYGQPTHKLDDYVKWYVLANGKITDANS